MRKKFRQKTAMMRLVSSAAAILFLFVSFTAGASQGQGKSENKSTAKFQGTISGQWSGSVSMSSETISVSGAFSVTISEDGHVLGTYTGVQSGTITGTVNSRGEINAKGSAGISEWSGKLSVENGRLSGSGTWEGFGGAVHGKLINRFSASLREPGVRKFFLAGRRCASCPEAPSCNNEPRYKDD